MAKAKATASAAERLTAERETLIADLNQIIVDAEQFLKTVGAEGNEQVQIMRAKVQESLGLARQRLLDLEASLIETGRAAKKKTRVAAQAADVYVHEHPWQTIGLVAGAGILIGLLLNRQQ